MKGALITGLSVILLLAGCAVQKTGLTPSKEGIRAKRIAVLPFNNISGKRDAGEIVTNIFMTEIFRSGKFQVEEPGNIIHFIIQEKVSTIGEMDIEKLQLLGRRLNVDAVIVGTVEEFDDGRSMSYPVPVVSVSARMVDPNGGTIIWSAQNKKKGDDYIIVFDFGQVRSISTLTKKVVNEMIETIK